VQTGNTSDPAPDEILDRPIDHDDVESAVLPPRISLPGASWRGYRHDMDQATMFAFLWTVFQFLCPRCGGTSSAPVERSNGRTRRCTGCHRHVSVTAGTAMRNTQLSVEAWQWVLEHLHELPSISTIADELEIARSTAWHLVHRIAKALAARQARESTAALEELAMPVRPAVGPPMAPAAPIPTDIGGVGVVDIALGSTASGRAFLAGIGPTDPSTTLARPSDPIAQRLWDQLVVFRQTVSLRWLPRWVALILAALDAEPPSLRLLGITAVPLRRLDPWLT
jgi:transposase-like protein